MFFFSLVLFCVGVGASSISQYLSIDKPIYSIDLAEDYFNEFIVKFGKTYVDENEKQMRFEIFKDTLYKINERNSDPEETAVFDIAEYADLTSEEFAKRYTGSDSSLATDDIPVIEVEGPVTVPLPVSFDWREHNAVTGVKKQLCGDCWTFAAAGVLEGAFAIKHKRLENFSEQQLIDCDESDHGCDGGLAVRGLRYWQENGAETRSDYPYEGLENQDCHFNPSKVIAKVTNVTTLNLDDEDRLRQVLVDSGPIGLSINASDLHGYNGNVLSKCAGDGHNHAVLLVGYGIEDGIPYWTIKNSWSTSFGENGYARLKRGINACGLMNNLITIASVA